VHSQPGTKASAHEQGALEVCLLGPLEIRRRGDALPLGGKRQRALLALLCLNRGIVVSVDRIVDELWTESPPPTARHMVEVYVSKLRKIVGSDLVRTRAPGYLLDLNPPSLDITCFERLLAHGSEALRRGEPDLALARLDEALSLWRGQALADFSYEPFAQAEIARLEDLRQLAEEERIETELALGHADELGPEIEALVSAHPLRERRHSQLMLALYRAGRQADALAAYRRARQVLVEELGIEPGPELRELERAILAHDSGLDVRQEGAPSTSRKQTRRVVTVLFAEPAERPDDGEPEMFQPQLAAAKMVLERHGGVLDDPLPDGTLVGLFGGEVAHEDDAIRALRAAHELRNLGLISRAAAESGEVVVVAQGEVEGPVFRAASKLICSASQAEILVSDATRRLSSHGVEFGPGVKSEGAVAWPLVHVSAHATARPLRGDAPIIGRDAELHTLRAAFASVVDDRALRVVTITGDAGIGKSRLANAFIQSVAGSEVQVATGRCLAYGEGITYWPLREVVAELAGDLTTTALSTVLAETDDDDAVAKRLTAAVGLSDQTLPAQEISWGTRRFLEVLGEKRPVVVVLEDLHWAEDTFLELVEHVAQSAEGASILLICIARPDLLERHANWMQNQSNGTLLPLPELAASDVEELVSQLDAGGLSETERRRVVEAAEGNPLFVEQLVAFALDSVQNRHGTDLPPNLRALLAARIDRLGPGERDVLECAAVVGREFSANAILTLLPPEARRTLSAHINSLSRKGLIEETVSVLPFQTDIRFRHVLLQDAVYRSISKIRRADLHERLARWLALQEEPGIDELVGYHFEQAYHHLRQVGRNDDLTKTLGRRAAQELDAGGQRAFDRGDYRAAVNLFGRCVNLLEATDPARLKPLLALGIAFYETVEFEQADAVLSEAAESARVGRQPALEWRARLERCAVRILTEPREGSGEGLQMARQAIAFFEQTHDESGLSIAWLLIANAWMFRFSLAEVLDAAEHAVHHARNAHNFRAESLGIDQLAVAMLYGSTPVADAINRMGSFLERARATENRSLEEGLLAQLGQLHAHQGDFDAARRLENERRAILSDLGQTAILPYVEWDQARISLLAGDAADAEARLRAAHGAMESAGDMGHLSTAILTLAEAVYRQGRYDEIETLVAQSDTVGSADDGANRIWTLRLRAKVLGRMGSLDDAEHLAAEAVALSRESGSPEFLGDALLDLGEVLTLAGKGVEAKLMLEAALAEYERKGSRASARRARETLMKGSAWQK
jgi:DNA-binding SARP family transcriptional activator